MEKGKIILIEGTDCSGKETQSKKLIEKLNEKGAKAQYYSFPNYSSPTGKIVGLPYLGKPYLARDMIEEIRYDVHDKLWPSLDNSVDFKIIDKVLKLHIFDNLDNSVVYQEYAYYDDELLSTGIIDLLIIKDNKYIIKLCTFCLVLS